MTQEMLTDAQDLVVTGIEANSSPTLNLEVNSFVLSQNRPEMILECSKIHQGKHGQKIRSCLALLHRFLK